MPNDRVGTDRVARVLTMIESVNLLCKRETKWQRAKRQTRERISRLWLRHAPLITCRDNVLRECIAIMRELGLLSDSRYIDTLVEHAAFGLSPIILRDQLKQLRFELSLKPVRFELSLKPDIKNKRRKPRRVKSYKGQQSYTFFEPGNVFNSYGDNWVNENAWDDIVKRNEETL